MDHPDVPIRVSKIKECLEGAAIRMGSWHLGPIYKVIQRVWIHAIAHKDVMRRDDIVNHEMHSLC